MTEWNCLIVSFFAVCSIIPPIHHSINSLVASFQQQLLQLDLRSHVPLKAWSADCLVFTRVSMLSFTRVYVVAPPCPHLRSEWVGLPETQHFWNLNTYLHARPLNPGSFYGHIFALLKAVYSILHLDFEAKIIIFFGITYLAIRGGLSFNRIFIWIRSLQTFTTWHFHLLLLLLLQWCYSNSRGDQQKVNIFAKKKTNQKNTRGKLCGMSRFYI